MSKVNKQRNARLAEQDGSAFEPPGANQHFARVIQSCGNYLHEVEPAEPIVEAAAADKSSESAPAEADTTTSTTLTTFLASMPTKFRKHNWVRNGHFVIIEMIPEGNRVKAEIVRILRPNHIREFRKDGIWPERFVEARNEDGRQQLEQEQADGGSDGDSDDDADLVRNTNRWNRKAAETSSEESSESSGDEEEEEEKRAAKK